MKSVLLCLVLTCWMAAADDTKAPAPVMPSEVTLTSGRVLRNVQVIRWEKDRVVLKYSGGTDPIAFALIKAPTLQELLAVKAASTNAKAAKADSKPVVMHGQVFDRGTDQPYRFVDLKVGYYESAPEVAYDADVPPAIVESTTDINGNFTLTVPARTGFIYARTQRSYRNGGRAIYEWTINLAEVTGDVVTLSGSNAYIRPLNRFGQPI